MENQIDTIKSRIKTLKAIFYIVMLVWLVVLVYTLYETFTDEINPMLAIALIVLVSSMFIISQLRKFQEKKLSELENNH
jgi:membrane protein YdbS with pleckstrin-like domain